MSKFNLENTVREVIAESTKVKFGGHQFLLKVDTNEDPSKSGIRISFIPTQFGAMNSTTQNDIAIELETRLEKGLAEFGLRVERDRQVKDKSVIRFFIHAEYLDRLVRKALEGQNPVKAGEEGAELPQASDVE